MGWIPMLDTILIVDATMIVGVLFVEAIGRSLKIMGGKLMATWMALWGWIVLLPFSISAILALTEFSFWTLIVTGISFATFTGWFLLAVTSFSISKNDQTQYIVDENSLDQKLKDGYVVVTVLKSGKVVVE